jgi:transposase
VPVSGSRHDWPEGQSSDLRRRRGQQTAEGRYQSGKSDLAGRISRAGDKFERSLLLEAAQCLAFRSGRAPALKAWFAALSVWKLAVNLHALLVHSRDFDETLQPTAAAA